jgi:hypothetical protein
MLLLLLTQPHRSPFSAVVIYQLGMDLAQANSVLRTGSLHVGHRRIIAWATGRGGSDMRHDASVDN